MSFFTTGSLCIERASLASQGLTSRCRVPYYVVRRGWWPLIGWKAGPQGGMARLPVNRFVDISMCTPRGGKLSYRRRIPLLSDVREDFTASSRGGISEATGSMHVGAQIHRRDSSVRR